MPAERKRNTFSIAARCCVAGPLLLSATFGAHAQVEDVSANYVWKAVRIGVGGFVVGMTLHPLDSTIRYARTDVGSAYRWDSREREWIAMRVANGDGSGIHSWMDTFAPATYGVDSIAVDPTNVDVVYMVFPTLHSCDVGCNDNYVQIYKSIDGGRNFAPGGLAAAAVTGKPNGDHRQYGERLAVDPANSKIIYYGSDKQGLLRSLDSGVSWTRNPAGTGLPTDIEIINIQFAREARKVIGAMQATGTVYAISMQNAGDAGGDVYRSVDGGKSWTDISTGVVDSASGTKLPHQASASSIDGAGNLYVVENPLTNGYHRAFWRLSTGQWTRFSLEKNGTVDIAQPLTSIVADPIAGKRLYAMGVDTSMSRSDDSGLTWTSFNAARYSNKLGWLPQTVGMTGGGWHSNGGLRFDRDGNLWVPTGQEGVLTMAGGNAAGGTAASPPTWTMEGAGIEEQVAQDVILPRGSGDTIVAAAEDTTGFVIKNPDTFSAVQIPLQKETIAQGTSLESAPDVPSYIAITSSNVYTNGPNYSGYSSDGGATWTAFGPALRYACSIKVKCDVPAGLIAVSVRGGRRLGNDHIVLLPPLNFAPQYSVDGGKSWHVSKSFPLAADGLHLDMTSGAYRGFFVPELHQHVLRADPFVADKFYLKLTHAPASLYISTDGGATWVAQPGAALPDGAFHGQLVTNAFLSDDLWYADGWEGSAVHGLFHSIDGGKTFSQFQGITHAINIAIGVGSGRPDDAGYSVYLYGQLATDTAFGMFQSTDGGITWTRMAFYPLGIYDRPVTLAASQDTFGKVVLGWAGNSFVYSQYSVHSH